MTTTTTDNDAKKLLGGHVLTVIGFVLALFGLGLRAPGKADGGVISIVIGLLATGAAVAAIFVIVCFKNYLI